MLTNSKLPLGVSLVEEAIASLDNTIIIIEYVDVQRVLDCIDVYTEKSLYGGSQHPNTYWDLPTYQSYQYSIFFTIIYYLNDHDMLR